jgi:hypothetical protein
VAEESFLSRWSQRKAEARKRPAAEPVALEHAPAEPILEEPAPAGEATPTGDPPKLELPDLDSLGPSSDYRPFMRPEVSADLRRDALRRLWRSNSIINTPDGLDDPYVTGDFTDRAVVVAGLRTLYKVGRGIAEAADALAEAGAPQERAAAEACPHSEPVLDSSQDEAPADGQPDRDTIKG